MSDSAELLVLRLALLGVIFLFVLVAAASMRAGLRSRPAPSRAVTSSYTKGARLVVIAPADSGLAPGAAFALAGTMTIGRDDDNSIVLGDESVSSRHATIEWTRRGWYLADLDSTNGTLLNGRTVTRRPVRLRGGEKIALGAVVVRFQP